ncbi:MAG: hypothetical protein NVV59_20635 [Chitinophagaceae bacterium]|nr:hypothetical protein [Chitinophagaceae bacterium]
MKSKDLIMIKIAIRYLSMPILLLLLVVCSNVKAGEKIPLFVKQNIPGAPQLLGVPLPQGKLYSPDHVRVLNSSGVEIASQITVVNTWEPLNESIKWLWVFFFSENSENYTLEYGEDVKKENHIQAKGCMLKTERDPLVQWM